MTKREDPEVKIERTSILTADGRYVGDVGWNYARRPSKNGSGLTVEDRSRVEFSHIEVLDTEKGNGYGRAAVEALEMMWRNEGVRRVDLVQVLPAAAWFWDRMGYVQKKPYVWDEEGYGHGFSKRL